MRSGEKRKTGNRRKPGRSKVFPVFLIFPVSLVFLRLPAANRLAVLDGLHGFKEDKRADRANRDNLAVDQGDGVGPALLFKGLQSLGVLGAYGGVQSVIVAHFYLPGKVGFQLKARQSCGLLRRPTRSSTMPGAVLAPAVAEHSDPSKSHGKPPCVVVLHTPPGYTEYTIASAGCQIACAHRHTPAWAGTYLTSVPARRILPSPA